MPALATIVAIASLTPLLAAKPPKPTPPPPAPYTYLELGTLGGNDATAFAINSAAQVVGFAHTYGAKAIYPSETTAPRWPWIAVPVR